MKLTESITLDNYPIGGRTLSEWHKWLNTDAETGDWTGHLRCPCSRYGHDSTDVAWYAIASTWAVCEDGAEWEAWLLGQMDRAVNDDPSVREYIIDYGYDIPTPLLDKIGGLPATCSVDDCDDEPDWSAPNGQCWAHLPADEDD